MLSGARFPALVVTDRRVDDVRAENADRPAADVVVVPLGDARPDVQVRTVVLDVADVAVLRSAAAGRAMGSARHLRCVVRSASQALTPRLHPMWGAAVSLECSLDDGAATTTLELGERRPVLEVWRALAAPLGAIGPEGLRVLPAGVPYDADAKVPPDLIGPPVPGSVGSDGEAAPAESHVLARRPVVLDVGAIEPFAPIDEAVFNPVGFPRAASEPEIDLPAEAVLTPEWAARLRRHVAVRVPASMADTRLAAGLAMSGVPLVAPDDAAQMLADPLRREEHSVLLRRGALMEHSTFAARRRVAARAGVRDTGWPSVSLLLATRRPEQLAFALPQLARQRTPDGGRCEIVVAAHGFAPDAAEVATLTDGAPVVVVTVAPEAVLGEVLQAAAEASSGDVVMKVDDDDWYGPDVVTDLVLARRYAHADLVGMPAEFVYLEGRDLTLRRIGPSENHGRQAAGGTLMLSRTLLRELGGFRPLGIGEDARLLDAVVRTGGVVYRTQGLGYVLRRRASGHTWDPGDDYFLRPETLTAQWPGFAPSALVTGPIEGTDR
ncbi:hypothetical protein [Nocardioides sp. R-C-SC26]|uniref:hypothetical protein n=1 Tax=Nocardioides sp. R-C-SC26 TaxID=2870414 RepID=UPI001E6206D9|nr:hypothetical protein [Nocardioides sp. R-C-SC26]